MCFVLGAVIIAKYIISLVGKLEELEQFNTYMLAFHREYQPREIKHINARNMPILKGGKSQVKELTITYSHH